MSSYTETAQETSMVLATAALVRSELQELKQEVMEIKGTIKL